MVWPCVLQGDVTSSTELAAGPVQIFTVAGGRREEGILRVLIIGGGGREHALAWKIAQSPLLGRLYCAPGNAGIAALARCVDLPVDDLEGICKFALDERIDLTVIGPEAPLAAGLADRLREAGLKAFGPSEEGARLESSKSWAKERMSRWGIPQLNLPFSTIMKQRGAIWRGAIGSGRWWSRQTGLLPAKVLLSPRIVLPLKRRSDRS